MFKVISVTEENDVKSIISVCEICNIGCIVRTQTIGMHGCGDALIFVPGVKLVGDTLQQLPIMQDGPMS